MPWFSLSADFDQSRVGYADVSRRDAASREVEMVVAPSNVYNEVARASAIVNTIPLVFHSPEESNIWMVVGTISLIKYSI